MIDKTLFLFEMIPDESFFFELEGDHSHLNGAYINSNGCSEVDSDELNDIVFDEQGGIRVVQLTEPSKDWTHFVKCGFLL